MADKKGGKPDPASQTRSETTAAAKTLFNNPEQPQSPVTTENLVKTIDKAVQEAFLKQEKKDLSTLKQGTKAAGAKAKKPRIRLMQEDDPQAKPRVRIMPEAQKIRGRFKTSQVPTNVVDEEQKPKKPKVRLKIPAVTTIPQDTPRKKPKVKYKGRVPTEPATSTGASINEIAEKLQFAEKQQAASKPKIKIKGTAVPFNRVAEPASAPAAIAPVAPAAAVKPVGEKAAAVLTQKAERVHAAEEEKSVEKVSAPEAGPKATVDKNMARKEAADALKSLGFKKAEFDKLLDQVDHIEKTEDKILYVLKLKDNPAAKIPKKEVPAAVEKAKEEKSEVIVPKKKEETAKPIEPKPAVDPNAPEQLTMFHNTPGAKVHPTATPAPGPAPAAIPKPAATDPEANNANKAGKDADQEKAAQDKKDADEKAEKLAQKKREDDIEKTLNKIEKKLNSNGIMDLIAMALSALAGKIFKLLGKGLWKLVALAGKAAWGAIKLAWKAVKSLFGSLKNWLKGGEKAGAKLGEKAAEKGGEKLLAKEAEKIGAEEAAKVGGKALGKSLLKKIPIIGAIAGLGFAAADLLSGDATGAAIDAASGIVSIVPGIGTAASIALDAYGAGRDLGIVGNKNGLKSEKAADKLSADNADHDDDDDETPPVVQHIDNRKTIVQGGSGQSEGTALIKVRNDEPTASGLIASIFDHPVSYGGVYRM